MSCALIIIQNVGNGKYWHKTIRPKKKKSNVSSDAVDRVACNLLSLNCECAHPSTFKKNPSGKLRNTFLMAPPVPLGLENFNKDRPIKIVAISMCDKLNMNFKLFIESS